MSAQSFVGKLASGKRVYVRRSRGDKSEAPIAFAVYVDFEPEFLRGVGRDGRRGLVARFHDPLLPRDRAQQMYCASGREHGLSACCWVRVPEPFSPEETAKWHAHWWSHVVGKPAEVVALVPADRHRTRAERVLLHAMKR